MTVADLRDRLGLRVLAGEDALDTPVTGCYVGDLLSWVIGRAQEGDCWVSVMGNLNAVAVAKLAEISAILLCDNAALDDDAKAQAAANSIPILQGDQPAYTMAVQISKLLG